MTDKFKPPRIVAVGNMDADVTLDDIQCYFMSDGSAVIWNMSTSEVKTILGLDPVFLTRVA